MLTQSFLFVLALRLNNERKVVAILHRICRIAFKEVKATAAPTAVNKIHGLMSTWEKCTLDCNLFPSLFPFDSFVARRRASIVQRSHSFCGPFACSYNRNDDDDDDDDNHGDDDDDTTSAFVVGMALCTTHSLHFAIHFVYLPFVYEEHIFKFTNCARKI